MSYAWAVAGMGKSAGEKISNSGVARHAEDEWLEPRPRSLHEATGVLTVRLDKSGRYFHCPHCHRLHRHPPDNLEFYVIGHATCELYAAVMPIEGGDRLGVVCVGADGRLHTVVYGSRASE